MGRTNRFESVKGDEHIARPLLDDGRGHVIAEADLARHRTAALGHAVDFALLDLVTRECRGLGEHVSRQDDSLTADANE